MGGITLKVAVPLSDRRSFLMVDDGGLVTKDDPK